MSGKRSRDKGNRIERELVNRMKALGLMSARVPLSGAAGGEYTGDLTLDLPSGQRLRAEAKGRADADGFKLISRWLANNDLLFLRRNRAEPLVVMPFAMFEQLLKPRIVSPELLNDLPPGEYLVATGLELVNTAERQQVLPMLRVEKLAPIALTEAEFNQLPEHHCSVPKEEVHGVRWKSPVGSATPTVWVVCEFVASANHRNGTKIEYYRPEITPHEAPASP